MKILFAINEAAPLYKLGGLGDVGGALPKALYSVGHDVRLILPYHPDIILPSDTIKQTDFTITYGRVNLKVTVHLTTLPNSAVPIYLLEEPEYIKTFSHTGDHYAHKYAVFSLGVTHFIKYSPHWQPDLIHCHDWHTALIPLLIKHQPELAHIPTLMTIHNLAYQGNTFVNLRENLNLDPAICQILQWDFQDKELNILLEGLLHVDAITTVSPNYAKEILTPQYGSHLESILQTKRHQLYGILNGIDDTVFNPSIDPLIPHHYTTETAAENKSLTKKEVLSQLHLEDQNLPLAIYIGRIDPQQKGIDLILQYLYRFSDFPPHNFIFLGTGDRDYEQKLHQAQSVSNRISIHTLFDEKLAHQLYAAADIILIPSNFEPCGLIQLIAMKYGTLPVAHKTGGLTDTIIDNQTGFLYSPNTFECMSAALKNAFSTIEQVNMKQKLIKAAMDQDFTWKKSALDYSRLYEKFSTATPTPELKIDNL